MTGFEPVTFCTQNKRATKLRHIPSIALQCHCRQFLSCFPHRYFLRYTYTKRNEYFAQMLGKGEMLFFCFKKKKSYLLLLDHCTKLNILILEESYGLHVQL